MKKLSQSVNNKKFNLKICLKALTVSLLSILFWQCDTEKLDNETSTQVEIEDYNYEINSISLNELPNLSSHLNRTLKRDIASRAANENEAIFDVENIMEVVDTLQNKNYSIGFSMSETPVNTFYNLIIGKDSTNVLTQPFVLRYASDEDGLDLFIENNYNIDYFKGTIYVHKYSDFFDLGIFSRGDKACPRETDQNGEPVACQQQSGSGGAVGGGSSSGSGNTGSGSGFSGWTSGTGGGGISVSYQNCRCHKRHNPNGCSHPVIVINLGGTQRSVMSKNASDCPECNVNTKGGVGINPDIAYRVRSIVNRLNSQIGLTSEQRIFLNKPENWTTTENINRFWRESDKGNETQNFITHALKALMDGGEVDFEELYINIEIFDDEYEETGQTSLIPNPLNLDNGDSVYLSFGTTKDGVNANQEVEQHLIDGLKFALNQANNNLTNKITDIYIMATTNGGHSSTSNHSKGSAIDISRINGQKMFTSGTTEQIVQLQIAFDNYQHIRENFGPYFKHKYSVETNTWDYNYPVGGHKDHIHISTRTNQ